MSKPAATLGQSIRRRRGELNLSQRELARSAGTTAAAISHVERGARNPSTDLLVRIADALQCSPNDLLSGADTATGESSHICEVTAAMKGFPPSLQKEVADFCDYLKHRVRITRR